MLRGQEIEIQLVDEAGNPVRLANVVAEIRLFYKEGPGRPLYRFDTWPTDAEGRSVTSFLDLEEQRTVLAFGALMDFNVPLTDCDPLVEVLVQPESEFTRRRAALLGMRSLWRPAWLIDWPGNGQLDPVQPRRIRLEGRVTRVEIPVRLRTPTGGQA